MKKMIHYQIAVSPTYPSTHKRKGEPTYFVPQIKNAIYDGLYVLMPDGTFINGKKFHTCRKNFALWVKRMKKVNNGDAVIDLFYWKLKGGRYTPNNEKIIFATLDNTSGCGVQELTKNDILPDGWYAYTTIGEEEFYSEIRTDKLAQNDGLCVEDFKEWFKNYDLSESLAIIQFTSFRY